MARYKEGVDYEMVDAKGTGGSAKTRRFFTKAEKEARKSPKAEPAKAAPKRSAPSISRAEPKKATPKPKANPARRPGGARPEGKAGGLPAARGKPREANPAIVGAMGAAAVGAAVAAGRAGRSGPGVGRSPTLSLPAPTRGGTVIPPVDKPKLLPKPTVENVGKPKPKPAAKPKPSAKPRAGAGRAVGANPGRRIRGPGGSNSKGFQLPDILDLKNM